MTSNEIVESLVLSTCLSVACLVLETVHTKSMPTCIELTERQKHHMPVMKTHKFHPIKSANRDKCIHNLVTHGPGYFEMVKEGGAGLYVASCRTGDYIIQ
uniref:Uncharacterized protein n=1 Tax=Magallana gigas TaxID=29159 RepID=K1PQU6_MAGGI